MINEKLNDLLEEKQVTLRELTEGTGISVSVLANYRQGVVKPTVAHLQALAKHLGVSVDKLTGRE